MIGDQDNYEAYYADKLWNLLPAVYRAKDSDQFNASGPLRELVNRIGAQAAVLRRSLDRLWEDQSIETCDDWVIPYLGDLLATNLVAHLDVRGQRLDVAKTIYYRRRKGTVAVLEEIAANITGWDAKVVELFRRLGRTRHGLDPAVGLPNTAPDDAAALLLAEGLVGPLTSTRIGGLADLRNVYGAAQARSPFDEYFHTADFRQGRGKVGWYNIPRLGVFLWRLNSFGVGPTTPVAVSDCAGWFTFDPTGRDVPLFATASRKSDSYGDNWVSPVEAQLPTAINQPLFDSQYPPASSSSAAPKPAFPLYPDSLAVFSTPTPTVNDKPVPVAKLKVRPPRGRFQMTPAPTSPIGVQYHYGFSSTIGAGPYDRRAGRTAPPTPPPPATGSGGTLGTVPSTGTLTFTDSLTYTPKTDVSVKGKLTVCAGIERRAVLRWQTKLGSWTQWTFNGTDPGPNCLVLDGLLLSGADIVLTGNFDCVMITCCTLDPGNVALQLPSTSHFALAADKQELLPCRLWIEGTVTSLTVERSITGPIRTRNGGQVETLTITDSIVQAIPTGDTGPIQARDVKDPLGFMNRLRGPDSVATYLRSRSPALTTAVAALPAQPPVPQGLLDVLNQMLTGRSLYDSAAFQTVLLSALTLKLRSQVTSPAAQAPQLNRRLLEDAFPQELADVALSFTDGDVNLSRCSVLGRGVVHHLQASECLLCDLVQVDDAQHGCVRFSAWTDGSILPRQYESVRIAQGAALFVSTDFGQPPYCQLLATVDAAILPASGAAPPIPPTIVGGAQNGSEMGAFARENNPIKERGLLIKYREFLPAGLVPVLIYAN
jgi:hypothetical protein